MFEGTAQREKKQVKLSPESDDSSNSNETFTSSGSSESEDK